LAHSPILKGDMCHPMINAWAHARKHFPNSGIQGEGAAMNTPHSMGLAQLDR
jgi:hypothetical protein